MTDEFQSIQANPKFFIYFDSNVISYIAHGQLPNLIPKIIENGGTPIVSEVVLEELRSGAPKGELDRIQQHVFMFASAHEALFLDGRVTFYTSPVEDDAAKDAEYVEEFLRQFMRSISGSASVPSLASLLLNSADDILNEFKSEFDSEADPRLHAAWNASRATLSSSFADLRSLPIPNSIDTEIEEMKALAKIIGNLKPPRILNQITLLPMLTEVDFLKDLVRPFTINENMKERIQILCMTLVAMGFARDKRLAKDDEFKSIAGAKSQFSDAYHIGAAASCNLLLTADKRCAKLAYAIYEALGFNTLVCLVTPGDNQNPFSILGPEFWP